MTSCLTPTHLANLAAGVPEGAGFSVAEARAHLDACAGCRSRSERLLRTANLLAVPETPVEISPKPSTWDAIQARIAADRAALPLANVAIACTYCKGRLPRAESVYCAGCLAPHHSDCWGDHGSCAACGVATLVRAEKHPGRAAAASPAVPWRRLARTLLVSVGLGAAACAGLVALGNWAFTTGDEPSLRRSKRIDTEADNAIINIRSQIDSARARLKDADAENALLDIRVARQIIGEAARFGASAQALSTLESEARSVAGDAHRMLGKLAEALEDYQEAARLAPRPSVMEKRARIAIARTYLEKGEPQPALASIDGVLDERPGGEVEVEARFLRASILSRMGDHDGAIAELDRLIDNPVADRWDATLMRGNELLALARFEEAERDFAQRIDHRNQDWAGYLGRGRARMGLGKCDTACDDLTLAIELQPSLPDGYYYRAELYFRQRKLSEAIKDYELATTRSGQFYEAYLGLGRALEWSLDNEHASTNYDTVVRATDAPPELRARAFAARGDLLALQSDRLEVQSEIDARDREAKATKGAVKPVPMALGDLVAIGGAESATRVRDAHLSYDEALKIDPELVPALVGRARLSLSQGLLDDAQRDLVAAETSARRRPAGSALCDVESLLGCVALARGQIEASLGHETVARGDFDTATQRFEAALAADKTSVTAMAGLAHAYRGRWGDDSAPAHGLFNKVHAELASVEGDDEAHYFHAVCMENMVEAVRSGKPEFYELTRRAFARLIARNPFHVLAYVERGRAAAYWKAWDFAFMDATRAIEADPWCHEAFELRGFLYGRDLPEKQDEHTQRPLKVRDAMLAIADFTRAIEVAPTGEAGNAYYGRALVQWGHYVDFGDGCERDKAASDIDEAVALIPPGLLDDMANDRFSIDQVRAAIDVCELDAKIHATGGFAARHAPLPDVAERMKKAALACLEAGRKLRDDRHYPEAVCKLDRATALDPELADVYYERGTCYLKIGNFVPGILDFSRALEKNPRYADQFYNKVYQVSYVVDLNRVITELNKIVADHPDLSYVVFLRGFFYVAKTEFKKYDLADIEAGTRDFDRTIELNPKHVTAMLYRGFLHYKAATVLPAWPGCDREKEFDAALAGYDLCLKGDPPSGIAHFLKGMCWSARSTDKGLPEDEKKKRVDTAVEELRISIEDCKFQGFDRVKNDKGFEAIRNDPRVVKLMQEKKQ